MDNLLIFTEQTKLQVGRIAWSTAINISVTR